MPLLDSATRTRLAKLLGMLGSAHDGERATAAAMADALVRVRGLTWDALLGIEHTTEAPGYVPPRRYSGRGDTAWAAAKPKNGLPGSWRRRHGVTLAVRQCRPARGDPPSWTATRAGTMLYPEGSSLPYLASETAARAVADAAADEAAGC